MTLISEAIIDAVRISGRPDKRADGIIFANKAIAKIVRKMSWPFDLREVPITFSDGTSYTQNIDITTQLPSFRKISYIRAGMSEDGTAKLFTQKHPSSIVTPCGDEILPSFYVTGNNIILKGQYPVANVMVGYYVQPPRLVEQPSSSTQTNTHWTLDIAYDATVDAIVAEIFASIGDDNSYGIYENKAQTAFLEVARDFIEAK